MQMHCKHVVVYVHAQETKCRHVKCNGSPLSPTEKGTVFHKTDFKKKSRIFEKPL